MATILKITHKIHTIFFEEFLLNLKNQTTDNFNPFGKITSSNVISIAKMELTRKDKIKFFSFYNDELIAYSYLSKFDKKHNCILGIVISDKWQGKGFGKKICKHMINHAWKKQFYKIWLTVFENNAAAINLYKSLGFEIEGIFINDEISSKQKRHVISMAIFKNHLSNINQRKKIWKNIE